MPQPPQLRVSAAVLTHSEPHSVWLPPQTMPVPPDPVVPAVPVIPLVTDPAQPASVRRAARQGPPSGIRTAFIAKQIPAHGEGDLFAHTRERKDLGPQPRGLVTDTRSEG